MVFKISPKLLELTIITNISSCITVLLQNQSINRDSVSDKSKICNNKDSRNISQRIITT